MKTGVSRWQATLEFPIIFLVWVDGEPIGNPSYSRPRTDVTARFPGLNNTNVPGGVFFFDSTAYENGVHTISWSVTDDSGKTGGVGSRFFKIEN